MTRVAWRGGGQPSEPRAVGVPGSAFDNLLTKVMEGDRGGSVSQCCSSKGTVERFCTRWLCVGVKSKLCDL